MLEQFYIKNRERHIKTISRILRYNKDLAEDIVQQSYLKALQHQDSYNPKKGSYNTWFNRILFNTLKTYQKDFGHTVSLNDSMEIDEGSLEYLILLDRELSTVKNHKHRQVLELFYRNGYSAKQIMETEHVSKTNVTTICNRFRNQLREKYGLNL